MAVSALRRPLERPAVLLVDDRPENLLAIEAVLQPLDLNLVRASSGEEALRRLLRENFAVILLDVQMPGMDGWQTAESIKRRPRNRDIPIIFISAISREPQHQLRGYATGAVDYLSKPFEPAVLRSKVAVFVELHQKNQLLRDQARELSRRLDERDRAQASLARQAAELERSNTDLEQFCYVASHDLQEPLRTVSGLLELLADRYAGELDEGGTLLVRRAEAGIARMAELIRDLLEYSQVGRDGRAPGVASAEDAFAAAMGNLAPVCERAAATVTSDRLPVVVADQWQLARVFENLVGNAVKFRASRPPLVHVAAARAADEWVFSVADNGIGVDPRFSGRVFTLFQRLHTNEEVEGTGIGLAICKRIVEGNGGRIWLESEPGRGTTVRFTMKAAE